MVIVSACAISNGMNLFIKTLFAYIKHLLGIWNEPKRYRQLYSKISDICAQNIMEIGTWRGKRARLMILEAQKHHSREEVSYFGFDLFETLSSETMNAEFSKQPPLMEMVKKELGTTGARIALYKGDTIKILPKVIDSLPKMDFIFIDGGHSLATVQNDWNYVSRLMHGGTVVIFDDYWPNKTDGGAKPIVDAIDRILYEVRILPKFDVFINPDYGRLIIKFAQVQKR